MISEIGLYTVVIESDENRLIKRVSNKKNNDKKNNNNISTLRTSQIFSKRIANVDMRKKSSHLNSTLHCKAEILLGNINLKMPACLKELKGFWTQ